MTLQIADRVKETTITTSTGPLTLAGAIVGYRTFASMCAVGDTCHYALQAVDATGVPTGDWEVGIGTYSATNTLTRTTILASSNAGAVVNLAAGTKQVWIDYPAAAINSGPLAGMRNKIIGGDFSTNPWQRGTAFANMASGTYMADRWQFISTSSAFFNAAINAFAPSVAQAGRLVTNSLLLLPTTADVTVGAGDFVCIEQTIEGYNWLGLAQQPCVLSFWHAHAKTGIYCVALRNSVPDRSFIGEYTQNVSGAWEKSTIVIPPSPAAGTWNYTNGIGLQVFFTIMSGTTYQTIPGVWQTGNFLATTNQVNGADSTANNFFIDLVQLEPGTIATPFEDLPFGTVLQLCQRYFCKSFAQDQAPASNIGVNKGETGWATILPGSVTSFSPTFDFPVTMRMNPTIALFNPGNTNAQVFNASTGVDCITSGISYSNDARVQIACTPAAPSVANQQLRVNWTANADF